MSRSEGKHPWYEGVKGEIDRAKKNNKSETYSHNNVSLKVVQ